MVNIERAILYCKNYEKIENFEEAMQDGNAMYHCHHRNERFYTRKELIDLGLYYDCPPCELIFLTPSDHHKTYHKGSSITSHSKEANAKISRALKGKHIPEDVKLRIKNTLKQKTTKSQILAKLYKQDSKGMKWNEFQKYYKEHNCVVR